MNTRYIANPEVRALRESIRANRTGNDNRESRVGKFATAAVLVAGIATAIPLTICSGRTPTSIEVNGSSAMMQKGFCAVRCSKSGNGAFYSNDIVYVEDWSTGTKYWKKFYDKRENLLVEGKGDVDNRWFFNPDHKGNAQLAHAMRFGNEWQTMGYYKGDEAVRKWNEVKVNY